jgi:hypothetical protein
MLAIIIVSSYESEEKMTTINSIAVSIVPIDSLSGGGGVQLGPLGTAAIDWLIVACPG